GRAGGGIPSATRRRPAGTAMPPPPTSFDLVRHLADLGWHVFPLANCRAGAPATGFPRAADFARRRIISRTGRLPRHAPEPRCRGTRAPARRTQTRSRDPGPQGRRLPGLVRPLRTRSPRHLVTAGLAAALVSTD